MTGPTPLQAWEQLVAAYEAWQPADPAATRLLRDALDALLAATLRCPGCRATANTTPGTQPGTPCPDCLPAFLEEPSAHDAATGCPVCGADSAHPCACTPRAPITGRQPGHPARDLPTGTRSSRVRGTRP